VVQENDKEVFEGLKTLQSRTVVTYVSAKPAAPIFRVCVVLHGIISHNLSPSLGHKCHPEDGRGRFLQNDGKHVPEYTVSEPRSSKANLIKEYLPPPEMYSCSVSREMSNNYTNGGEFFPPPEILQALQSSASAWLNVWSFTVCRHLNQPQLPHGMTEISQSAGTRINENCRIEHLKFHNLQALESMATAWLNAWSFKICRH
jgi:hypothetical protein